LDDIVLRSLEPYQQFCITSDNSGSLSGDAALVLVTRNLKMLAILLDLLCNIMHSLHSIKICLPNHYLQVLRHVLFLLAFPRNYVQLPTLISAEAILKEDSDHSLIILHQSVSLKGGSRLE
jgi:hypothetical protein